MKQRFLSWKKQFFSIPSLLLFLFSSLFLSSTLYSLNIPPVPNTYISDGAGLLSSSTQQALEQQLAQFERETTNQILVAAFPDLQGDTIEEFSIRLAEKWKPGQTGRDNGVILVVSKGDRKVRIEVGYGLEGALTDALSKSILENEILPHFKRGEFDHGVLSGVAAIQKAIVGEYQAKPASHSRVSNKLPLVIFLLFFFLFIPAAFILKLMALGVGINRGGNYRGYGGGWGGHSGGSGWGGSSGGFGSGGGSFGGGGASGGW